MQAERNQNTLSVLVDCATENNRRLPGAHTHTHTITWRGWTPSVAGIELVSQFTSSRGHVATSAIIGTVYVLHSVEYHK